MIVNVKVIPNAKKNEVIKEKCWKVYVNSPAVDNKANIAVIAVLSDHFHVSKNKIRIVKGMKSREKIIEIIY